MLELPDIEHYLVALDSRMRGIRLVSLTIQSPFLLRTVEPGVSGVTGLRVVDLKRIGKRIAIELKHEIWLVIHLMIAGRLGWKPGSDKKKTRKTLAVFEFDSGNPILTEARSKKRASLHIVKGREALTALDPQGLEILEADQQEFAARLVMRNHTLKRALTDPRLFSGIGNAYSDEILHHAKLSPIAQT
jgi:formamidopyrimidine-DNA glycosylase